MSTPASRYQGNDGTIVYAQPIIEVGFDMDRETRESRAFVTLADGTKESRPKVHGVPTHIGDWFVRGPMKVITTKIGRFVNTTTEPGETAIVPKDQFPALYKAVE